MVTTFRYPNKSFGSRDVEAAASAYHDYHVQIVIERQASD